MVTGQKKRAAFFRNTFQDSIWRAKVNVRIRLGRESAIAQWRLWAAGTGSAILAVPST